MAPDDPNDPSAGASAGESAASSRPQDPIVERRRPDPAQPPEPTVRMLGFLGDSDRPGFRRLYFTRDLDYYAEFRVEDVVDLEAIPAEEPPFPGDEATRLTLRREATVEYTRIRTAGPIDEFDADVRLGRRLAGFGLRGDWVERDSADTRCASMCGTWCNNNTCNGTCPENWSCPDTCQGGVCPYQVILGPEFRHIPRPPELR